MKPRRGMVVLLAFLASCGSSAASSGTGTASSRTGTASSGTGAGTSPAGTGTAAGHCGPAGATTLASSPQARVYTWHGAVFGCTVAQNHPIQLGSAARSIRVSRASPVALAGVDVAYGLSDFGVDTVRTDVVVRRLTDGKQLRDFPATKAVGVESFQSVGSIVVRSNGAVAWIGIERSIIGHRGAIEVHAADGSAGPDRLLDSGTQIVPDSLRLRGDTLSWASGGGTRHATVR